MLILLWSDLGFLVVFVFSCIQHSPFVYLIRPHIYNSFFLHGSCLFTSSSCSSLNPVCKPRSINWCVLVPLPRCFCFPQRMFLEAESCLRAGHCSQHLQSLVLPRAHLRPVGRSIWSVPSALCSWCSRFISHFSVHKVSAWGSTTLNHLQFSYGMSSTSNYGLILGLHNCKTTGRF